MKKFICAAIVAVVCITALAGCGYNPENVMTVDGYDVPAGVFLYFQFNATQQASSEVDTDIAGTPKIYDATINGIPARKWIDNKTMELVQNFVFVEKEAAHLSIAADDAMLAYYAQQEWQNYETLLKKNGISYDTFEIIYLNQYKSNQVMTTLYGEGGELEISAEQMQAYFEKHYTKLDYFSIDTTTEDGYLFSSEAVDEILKLTDEMLAYAKETGSMEAAFDQYYQQILDVTNPPEEAVEEPEEPETTASDETDEETPPEPTFYQETARIDNILNDTATSPDAEFVAAVFAAKQGEILLFKNEDESVVILYQVTGLGEEDTFEDFKTAILSAMAEGPFEALIKEATGKYVVETDEKAKKYYSVDNVRFK